MDLQQFCISLTFRPRLIRRSHSLNSRHETIAGEGRREGVCGFLACTRQIGQLFLKARPEAIIEATGKPKACAVLAARRRGCTKRVCADPQPFVPHRAAIDSARWTPANYFHPPSNCNAGADCRRQKDDTARSCKTAPIGRRRCFSWGCCLLRRVGSTWPRICFRGPRRGNQKTRSITINLAWPWLDAGRRSGLPAAFSGRSSFKAIITRPGTIWGTPCAGRIGRMRQWPPMSRRCGLSRTMPRRISTWPTRSAIRAAWSRPSPRIGGRSRSGLTWPTPATTLATCWWMPDRSSRRSQRLRN